MKPGEINRSSTIKRKNGGSSGVSTLQGRAAAPKASSERSCLYGMNLPSDPRKKLSSGISSMRTVATEKLVVGYNAAGAFVDHLGSASRALARTGDVAEITGRVLAEVGNTSLGTRYGVDTIAKALGNGILRMKELQQLVAQAHMTGMDGMKMVRSVVYGAKSDKAEQTPPVPQPDGAQPTAA